MDLAAARVAVEGDDAGSPAAPIAELSPEEDNG